MSVFAPVLAKLATDAAAATELAELAKAQGVAVIISSKLIAELETLAGTAGKDGKAREGAMVAVSALCTSLGQLVEPLLVKLLPVILDKAGDKVRVAPCSPARRGPASPDCPLQSCATRVRRPCAGP